jgi:hypothetical protein
MTQERDDDVTCWIMHEIPWDFWQFSGARPKIYASVGDRERAIPLFLLFAHSTLQIWYTDANILTGNVQLMILSNLRVRFYWLVNTLIISEIIKILSNVSWYRDK